MKTATSVILIACVFFVNSPNAFAQGGQDVCEQCICVATDDCYEADGCPDPLETTGCRDNSFVASCSGDYTIRALLTCPSGVTCKYCTACALLYESGESNPVCIEHTVCDPNDCVREAVNACANLSYGVTYVLYVCLIPCSGSECEACEGCVARAYVYADNFEDCDYIAACNP